MQLPVGVGVADLLRVRLAVVASRAEEHEVTLVLVLGIPLHEESLMPECNRRGKESVAPRDATGCLVGLRIEHGGVAHAEVVAERMEVPQVEVHKPRLLEETRLLVLRVVAVHDATVEVLGLSLRIDRPADDTALEVEELAK